MMARSSAGVRPVFTSTSTPRSRKISTAAGESLSLIRTLGMRIRRHFAAACGGRVRARPAAAGPVEPGQQRLDIGAFPPSRRPRCAGPAARRDRRRCRRRRPAVSSSVASCFAAFACASGDSAVNQGAMIVRQIEVQERDGGILGQESRPVAPRDPVGDGGEIGLAARDQRRQPADAAPPSAARPARPRRRASTAC